MTLKSVVFPEPFGPMIPWISPAPTSSETPTRACRPLNLLLTESTRRATTPAAGRAARLRPADAQHREEQQRGAWAEGVGTDVSSVVRVPHTRDPADQTGDEERHQPVVANLDTGRGRGEHVVSHGLEAAPER